MMDGQLSASVHSLTPEERANLQGRSVRVYLSPRCRCGGRMEFTGRHHTPAAWYGALPSAEVWRCNRRRWWNWWKHPYEYMLPERR